MNYHFTKKSKYMFRCILINTE